jgi:hypothetical protein
MQAAAAPDGFTALHFLLSNFSSWHSACCAEQRPSFLLHCSTNAIILAALFNDGMPNADASRKQTAEVPLCRGGASMRAYATLS